MARLVVRLGGHRSRGRGRPPLVLPARAVRLGARGGALPVRLAAWPVPGAWLPEPRGRPHAHLEFVVAGGRGPRAGGAARRRRPAASWRVRRGRGVVTWKSAESITAFLGRIGASAALLELEARQVARQLRGELNRVLNAESANLQRSVAASGRQLGGDRRARDRRSIGRAATDRARGRGGPARDPGGVAVRDRDPARPPPLGRAARARPPRAPGPPRRRGRGAPAASGPGSPGAAGGPGRRRRLWHDQAMRPVVIAANWKMNTTPADAGELARHDRVTDPGARRDARDLPAVRLPGGGAGRARGRGRRGRRPERPPRARGRLHRRGVRADAGGPRDVGDPRPLGASPKPGRRTS